MLALGLATVDPTDATVVVEPVVVGAVGTDAVGWPHGVVASVPVAAVTVDRVAVVADTEVVAAAVVVTGGAVVAVTMVVVVVVAVVADEEPVWVAMTWSRVETISVLGLPRPVEAVAEVVIVAPAPVDPAHGLAGATGVCVAPRSAAEAAPAAVNPARTTTERARRTTPPP